MLDRSKTLVLSTLFILSFTTSIMSFDRWVYIVEYFEFCEPTKIKISTVFLIYTFLLVAY